MASTNTPSGAMSIALQLLNTFGGDSAGQRLASGGWQYNFLSGVATAPDIQITGWLKGVATVTNVSATLEFAHASDPLSTIGDAAYCDGFAPAGKKLVAIFLYNRSQTQTITVTRPASLGLSIVTASGAITLAPLSAFALIVPSGITAALVTGGAGNDKLSVVTGAGTADMDVIAVYS